MSKYEIGDRFVVTITNVCDSGMGTEYYLNDVMRATDFDLDKFEIEQLVPLSKESEQQIDGSKTYTPEDLLSRILYLSGVLKDVIEKYVDMKGTLEEGIPNLDRIIEDNRL